MTILIGQTLGKYQLVERLGRGGMADVYKGYQPGLDRYVAVKVLHAHLSEDPDFITRFRREAKSVSELHHPYIIQVFDFDVQADNYYMVMEYVEGGKTLKEILQDLSARGERLPLDKTLEIVSKLADALAYAHGLGMIHRDIKPANVLIPSLDRPVLSDFGIARIVGQTGLTTSGERGDARSDIYALGIVLYEMLTGRPPYDADTPYAIILKHINDPIVPPHVVIGPLPDAVERIVLKCLAKNPDDRFASMADLRDALPAARAAIGGEKDKQTVDVSAPPTLAAKSQLAARAPQPAPSSKMPVSQPSRRPMWAFALVAVLIVGVAIVLLSTSRGSAPQAATPPPIAGGAVVTPDRPRPAAPISQAQPLVEQGHQRLLAGDLDAALDLFQKALAIEPDNPDALVGRAVANLSRGTNVQDAKSDLDRAARIKPNDPVLFYGQGLLHAHTDPYADANAAMSEFTAAIDTCSDRDALCSAAYAERAQLNAWTLGHIEPALHDMDIAIQRHPDRDTVYSLYAMRADMRAGGGDSAGARKDFETAYQLTHSGEYLEKAAAIAVKIRDYPAALDDYARLLNEHAGDPHYLVGRGYVEWQAGQPDVAMQTVQRAIKLSDPLEAHYLLGLLWLERGRPQDALAEFGKVSSVTDLDLLSQASFPFLTRDFGHEIFYDSAHAAHAMRDLDLALSFIDRSLKRDDSWPYPYIERGKILFEKGDLAGARESYQAALERASDNPDLKALIEQALVGLSK
jgi:tetratricopeptide (TPR) repeat protein